MYWGLEEDANVRGGWRPEKRNIVELEHKLNQLDEEQQRQIERYEHIIARARSLDLAASIQPSRASGHPVMSEDEEEDLLSARRPTRLNWKGLHLSKDTPVSPRRTYGTSQSPSQEKPSQAPPSPRFEARYISRHDNEDDIDVDYHRSPSTNRGLESEHQRPMTARNPPTRSAWDEPGQSYTSRTESPGAFSERFTANSVFARWGASRAKLWDFEYGSVQRGAVRASSEASFGTEARPEAVPQSDACMSFYPRPGTMSPGSKFHDLSMGSIGQPQPNSGPPSPLPQAMGTSKPSKSVKPKGIPPTSATKTASKSKLEKSKRSKSTGPRVDRSEVPRPVSSKPDSDTNPGSPVRGNVHEKLIGTPTINGAPIRSDCSPNLISSVTKSITGTPTGGTPIRTDSSPLFVSSASKSIIGTPTGSLTGTPGMARPKLRDSPTLSAARARRSRSCGVGGSHVRSPSVNSLMSGESSSKAALAPLSPESEARRLAIIRQRAKEREKRWQEQKAKAEALILEDEMMKQEQKNKEMEEKKVLLEKRQELLAIDRRRTRRYSERRMAMKGDDNGDEPVNVLQESPVRAKVVRSTSASSRLGSSKPQASSPKASQRPPISRTGSYRTTSPKFPRGMDAIPEIQDDLLFDVKHEVRDLDSLLEQQEAKQKRKIERGRAASMASKEATRQRAASIENRPPWGSSKGKMLAEDAKLAGPADVKLPPKKPRPPMFAKRRPSFGSEDAQPLGQVNKEQPKTQKSRPEGKTKTKAEQEALYRRRQIQKEGSHGTGNLLALDPLLDDDDGKENIAPTNMDW